MPSVMHEIPWDARESTPVERVCKSQQFLGAVVPFSLKQEASASVSGGTVTIFMTEKECYNSQKKEGIS